MRRGLLALPVAAVAAVAALLTGVWLDARPAEGGSAATPVRLILQWEPQAQFAGYYMAAEKGIYSARGLDVEVVSGGPTIDPIAYLWDGEADFATSFLTGALEAYGKGPPIVDICQVVNRSNLLIVAHRSSVKDRDELDGSRMSLWGSSFRSAYLDFFDAAGVRPELVPQYYTVSLFLRGGVDACAAMEYNEFHTIIQSGIDSDELTTISLRDAGFDFPEDGVYTLASTQRERPGLCLRFAAATMEGWRYCRDHPTEALDVVMREARQAHVPTNRVHQQWMLEHILASIFAQGDAEDEGVEADASGEPGTGAGDGGRGAGPGTWRPGKLARDDYERTRATMTAEGRLDGAPAYEDFVAPEARSAP